MCGDQLRKWVVLVVCLCGGAVAVEANEPAAEPNEPWIAAEHLMAGWQSMALTTRYFSPEGPSGNKTPQRSVSFAGRIDVLDPNGLIGLSEVATNAKALDELGDPIDTTRVSQYPILYLPVRYSTKIQLGTGQRITSPVPYNFTIDMTMGRGAPFPLMFSRLEWSVSALLTDNLQPIDIAFAPTADWVPLTPGLEIFVEEAVVKEGQYSYRIKARYDPNEVTYLDARSKPAGFMGRSSEAPYSWPTNIRPLPEMIVTSIDIVDANGVPVWQQSTGGRSEGSSGGFSDSDGWRIATRSGNGFCAKCGQAAFIRHVIAFRPYNRELQFVLENVPVPTE